MSAFIIIAGLWTWWAIGVASFVYWWTNDGDFTWTEVPLAAIMGILGPIAYPMGAFVHGDSNKRSCIIRRRNR